MDEQLIDGDERRAEKLAIDAKDGLQECMCGRLTRNVIADERQPMAACCPGCAGGKAVCTREEHEQRWYDDD